MNTAARAIVVSTITFLLFISCGNNPDQVVPKNNGSGQTLPSVSSGSVQTGKNETTDTKGEKITFVELGSVKCIPCRMMQPVMEAIKKEYEGRVDVVFHDVWTPEGSEYGRKYRIRVIPTQVFLDAEGKEYYRHEGFFPKAELIKILEMKGVK